MIGFLINTAESIWVMLVDSAFLLLLGIIIAGFIHLLLNETNLKSILINSKKGSILKAALFGVPLPLCSCSVLPMAHQLRQSGLNRGATASFLVSTPETGVDSILLTYSLTDPLMTVARPISAFVTAMTAGLLISKFDDDNDSSQVELPQATETDSCNCESDQVKGNSSLKEKIVSSLKYSFTDILKDLAPYLLLGYVLAGLISVLLGDQIGSLPSFLTNGWGGYIGAVLIGLPLYICATSSTPLAAAVLAAGFSPGAVLVFLLVGPATNVATLTVASKILKKRGAVLYLVAIISVALISGLLLDYIYNALEFNPVYKSGEKHHLDNISGLVSAAILSYFILYYSIKKAVSRLF